MEIEIPSPIDDGELPVLVEPELQRSIRKIALLPGEFSLSIYDDRFVSGKGSGLLDRRHFKKMALTYAGEREVYGASNNSSLISYIVDKSRSAEDEMISSVALYTHGDAGKSPGVNQVQISNEQWALLEGRVLN